MPKLESHDLKTKMDEHVVAMLKQHNIDANDNE